MDGSLLFPMINDIAFRPFQPSPEVVNVPHLWTWFQHPFFALLGLRPVFAQHTRTEHEYLKRWACERKILVAVQREG